MGDSDDEYDRKRRDKFRGERGGTAGAEGGAYRGGERREERARGREDWADRNRRDYREYRGGGAGGGRERGYSPGRGDGPPAKRIRGEWEDLGRPRYASAHDGYTAYSWSHDHYGGHHPPHQGYGHAAAQHRENTNGTIGETQPAMMSFKAFLGAQDDAITDDDAIKKYNEYKLEFRRQQLNEFFVAHKEEEWFKIKYHPEESLKRKEEQLTSLRNRLTVFMELLNEGSVESVAVESDQSEKLIRLLDTVVIKLEGGDEEDLKVLDEKPKPLPLIERPAEAEVIVENSEEATPVTSAVDEVADPEKKLPTEDVAKESPQKKNDETDDLSEFEKSESNELPEEKKDITEDDSKDTEKKDDTEEEKGEEDKIEKSKPEKAKKRKREYSSGSGSSSSSDSESDGEVTAPKSPEPEKEPGEEMEEDKKSDVEDTEEIPEAKEPEKKPEEEKEVPTVEVEDENKEKEPRALHKTTSIFLRNLSPTITKAEVEAMCKRYTGYLRVAIADPLQERRWFRRGWLTFRREVNIKEICWNLNNIRLRECELGAIVNRDLSRRVRPVSGLTAHKQVVRSDIKLCAKITHNLDSKANLWLDNEEKKSIQQSFGLVSRNPVLHNITDYLIEEASAEEDELLGLTGSADNGENDESKGETIERDAALTKVLDKLILYLRIVHSVDFYNHCEYPYEDEMPNRCGIMHARGPPPSNKVTQNEINEYIRMFEVKMSTFLAPLQELDEDEFNKLGAKDSEGEVEKFVLANTQELAKDKWLCPLSGKKFKGPDFIRKHIFNKHGEKVDEVKKEVEYFNNYLRDPKRPQLPEHPGNARKPEGGAAHHPPPYGGYGPPPGPTYGGRGGYHHMPYGGFGFQGYAPRPRGGFNRGREPTTEIRRPIVAYNDLDLPESSDYF